MDLLSFLKVIKLCCILMLWRLKGFNKFNEGDQQLDFSSTKCRNFRRVLQALTC